MKYSSLAWFRHASLYLFAAVAALGLSACDGADDLVPQASVLVGATTAIGDGTAWTEVNLDATGTPTALWIVMTSDALDNLPAGHGQPPEYVLSLPAGATVPPYDHVSVDWNAHGHAPPGVYDVPHFDYHFYFQSITERDRIGPDDSTAFNRPLPAEQLPAMYLETPGGVPRMGAHVIDLQSPEVAGSGPFTHTFIYGKYDGTLTFLEPMVSDSFLRTDPDLTLPIRQPATFGREGYFPGQYRIVYDASADTYRVGLTDLQAR